MSQLLSVQSGRSLEGGLTIPQAEASTPTVGEAGRVVVLLPALNEARSIGRVIDQIPREPFEQRGYDVSVWVVDGHSEDATLDVARRRGASVFVQRGNGKGSGVRQAFEHLFCPEDHGGENRAKRCFFFMMDSDGTYPPQRTAALLRALEAGNDVVLGSRFLGRIDDDAITGFNRIGNRILSLLARILYGVPVSDVCTGMWGFNESFLRRSDLMANGFDLEADIFACACRLNAKFAEIPVDYYRRVGEPKLVPIRAGFLIAWCLIKRWLFPPAGRPSVQDSQRPLR